MAKKVVNTSGKRKTAVARATVLNQKLLDGKSLNLSP